MASNLIRNRSTARRLAAVLGVLMAAGCTAVAPQWESGFGDAVRQARALQVIDPAAPSRPSGKPETDAKAIAGAQRGYAESYGYAVKEAKPTNALTLVPIGK